MAQPSDLVDRTRFLVKVVLVGTVVLLVLLISIFLIVPHETMSEPIIVFWGIFILIAALIAGIALAYLFQTRVQMGPAGPDSLRGPAPEAAEAISGTASAPELEDLAIRLLDGDERRLMRVIVEAKGDILQRDLVRVTAFSDAKVSRLLDRLEERGLVVRERKGMANRVRLTLKET
ncbi:MAG: MarR family transcriptional regulator [Candidatus Thermoplasmatota archaeon]